MPEAFTFPAWPELDAARPGGSDSDAAPNQGWASLLEWCYRRAGLELPSLRRVSPDELPQPYRALLAHSADMTPTLEEFYLQSLGLTVLSHEVHDDVYRREVALTVGALRQPVLYGAIRILLNHLPNRVRQRVLEERDPLGHILQTEGTPHLSWPQAFFRVEPDPHISTVLRSPGARELFGRRNVLVDGSRQLLAEVIEILAPAGAGPTSPQNA